MKERISIVIPCYRSEGMIEGVVEEIEKEMEKLRERYSLSLIHI